MSCQPCVFTYKHDLVLWVFQLTLMQEYIMSYSWRVTTERLVKLIFFPFSLQQFPRDATTAKRKSYWLSSHYRRCFHYVHIPFPALMRILIWALKTSLAHRVKYDIPQRPSQINLSQAFTAVISRGNELFKSVEPSTHQHRRPQQSEGQN